MKTLFIILFISLSISISGCADPKEINGITYNTYGLFDQSEKKNPDIEYRLSIGNIVWSVILVETIIAPFYFIGFDLYEPIGKKDLGKVKGEL